MLEFGEDSTPDLIDMIDWYRTNGYCPECCRFRQKDSCRMRYKRWESLLAAFRSHYWKMWDLILSGELRHLLLADGCMTSYAAC